MAFQTGGRSWQDARSGQVQILEKHCHVGAASDRSCDFPKVTQLDFTGPLQVFSSVPGAKVHLIWKRIEPVPSDSVLTLTPTITFADCPQLDVICVPGGARHRRHDQRRGDAGLPAPAGGGREIHHLGLHGIAGAGRGRPAPRLSRGDALDGDGISGRVRRDTDRTAASASTATASPAAASPRASISR